MLNPSDPKMKGNSEVYIDDQSKEDKDEQACKGIEPEGETEDKADRGRDAENRSSEKTSMKEQDEKDEEDDE